MIFVVVEDVIPESQRAGNTDLSTLPIVWVCDNDDTGYLVKLTKMVSTIREITTNDENKPFWVIDSFDFSKGINEFRLSDLQYEN